MTSVCKMEGRKQSGLQDYPPLLTVKDTESNMNTFVKLTDICMLDISTCFMSSCIHLYKLYRHIYTYTFNYIQITV